MTDRSSDIDLLPCPFCGNPPFVDDDRDGVCTITCATDNCIGVEITCPTRDDAAGFWNTRAPTRSPEWLAGQQRIPTAEEVHAAIAGALERLGIGMTYTPIEQAAEAVQKLYRDAVAGDAKAPCHGLDDAFCMICNPPMPSPERSSEWREGQERIHRREKPDHAVYEMHKGGEP